MLTTSVVVRAFNEERHIARLLTGIAWQTRQPMEVVLVDSGSTDATVAIARRFPLVRVLHIEPDAFSFGRALNLGCAAARGDLLVFASAHVYPLYRTWLEHLLEPFEDPTIALAYGRQQGDERTQFSELQVMRKWFPASSAPRQEHPFCNNANAAIRRSTWEALPYDEELTGLEDLDWATRAMASGFGISYVAEAAVAHVHRESWRQTLNRYRREAMAHVRISPGERLGLGEATWLATANIGVDMVRALREGVLRGNVASIVRFRSAQFAGSYLGSSSRQVESTALKRRFYYPSKPRFWLPATPPATACPIDYAATPEPPDPSRE